MKCWKNKSYIEIVQEFASIFIDEDEIPKKDLNQLIQKAFECFANSDVVKIAELEDNLNILELFHGPTMTFKDLALSVVGQLFDYFLEKRKKHTTILVGTSGDTGSAAIEAVKNLKWVDIIVLLPKDRCTQIQERQMTTVISDNVHIYSVEGTSDDLDIPIKNAFSDPEYIRKHNLCSINSINWARIMVQTVHHIYSYLKMCGQIGDPVEVVIPTGACGNLASGYLANQMGFNLKFIVSVAPNDIVHRTLKSGVFSLASEVKKSWATAIDIQVPYNIERVLLMASDFNTNLVKDIMKEFENNKTVEFPKNLIDVIRSTIIDSITVSNDEILNVIDKCYQKNEYLICPHTAVAVKYHFENNTGKVPRICVSTASSDKFPEALTEAGINLKDSSDQIKELLKKPTKFQMMTKKDNWDLKLRNKISMITEKNV